MYSKTFFCQYNQISSIGNSHNEDTHVPDEIITHNKKLHGKHTNIHSDDSYKDDDASDNEESSSNIVESHTTSNLNVDDIVKKEVKKKSFHYICAKEQTELNLYIKNNLFRRLKIVNEKHTHSIVFQCFDHMQIYDDDKRSNKFKNVLDFLNTAINARRNYLKHQIIRVMRGKYTNINQCALIFL